MGEFANLDRCAAYVAVRSTHAAVQRFGDSWPQSLADRTHRAAAAAMQVTADAVSFGQGSIRRRRRLRDALTSTVTVASCIDLARAMGFGSRELDDAQRLAGRSIALLGMLLHADTSPVSESA
jgi:hypothetical protein